METENKYLTPDEAADILKVHRTRLYALHREGRYGRVIDGYVVFTLEEVLQYKAERDKRPRGGRPSFHNRPKDQISTATR